MRYSTAVFDLDNTFYDWVAVFAAATKTFVRHLSDRSGVLPDVVGAELRELYATTGTLENPFLVQQLPCIRALHPGTDPMAIVARYADTVTAVQTARRTALVLYPGVRDGLELLRAKGVQMLVITSAPAFAAIQRLRTLDLGEYFDLVVAAEDVLPPTGTDVTKLRRRPEASYNTSVPVMESKVRKPDPAHLLSALAAVDADPAGSVMVGDDVLSDVGMAHAAGVAAIWARYGTLQRPDDRATLVEFSPWAPTRAADQNSTTPDARGYGGVPVANSFAAVVDLILA